MKVLVTGGYGFIGSAVARKFYQEGADIFILDNLSTGHLGNISFPHKSYLLNVEDEICAHFFNEINFDVIVHCAAQTSVQQSVEMPMTDIIPNVVGVSNMLNLASKYGVKHFVFASSAAVYGTSSMTPLVEERACKPISMYGLNKWIGEMYCTKWSNDYGLPTLIYRFSNVYGGEGAVIPTMLKSCKENSVFTIHGDGQQTRDFVFVDDIADAIFEGVQAKLEGIYNVSTNEAWSVKHITLLLQHFNNPLEIQYSKARVGDIRHSILSNEKLSKAINWKPRYSFTDGIDCTLQAMQVEKFLKM
ncbi:MAG: NAD-dependent epimerase/dehydratase family protein [Lysinibacillus sp.]